MSDAVPGSGAGARFRRPGPWDGAGPSAGCWTMSSTARPSRAAPTSRPTGPVIFAGNHISFLDGPVMFGASPRPMHILVKKEMFKGFLGRVLRASGQLPVDRAGDRAALQLSKAVLDAGRCVGILPEGTRGSGKAAGISNGVAWLALNSRGHGGAGGHPGHAAGRRTPGHGSQARAAGSTSASAKPLTHQPESRRNRACFNGQGGNGNPRCAGGTRPGHHPSQRAGLALRGFPARTFQRSSRVAGRSPLRKVQ